MESTSTQSKIEIKVPSMWKVVMHNDDYTPEDFVVELLRVVFNKPQNVAETLTKTIHETGKSVIGLYTKEIALTKVKMAMTVAEEFDHPLLTTAEES